jgi:anti-anti-sigma factor
VDSGVSVSRAGGTAVITAWGEFDLSNAHVLASALTGACAEGQRIALDLTAVTFLDSSAVRAIELARDCGCLERVDHAQPLPRRILDIFGLSGLLESPV